MCKAGTPISEIAFSALEIYNKTRSPEATARIISIDESRGIVRVEFTGAFCLTCGIRDWVEDYAYLIKSLGFDAELLEYIEPGDDEFKRIGVFRVNPCRGGD